MKQNKNDNRNNNQHGIQNINNYKNTSMEN